MPARVSLSPSGGEEPFVRLDSLDPERGGRSFRFDGLRRVIRAESVAEVVPALREVEREAGEGGHGVGFVAYEAAPAFDPALRAHPPRPGLPLLWFAVYAERTEVAFRAGAGEPASLGPWEPSVSRAEYVAAVERIRALIAAGDTYQVNHTFRLRARLQGEEDVLYERLCGSQRAAYCALMRLPGWSVLSASPELFFRWAGGELELRPMKGTRARGRWPEEDLAMAAELLESPKERAENLMIVDLLRNDAGRVSEFGSVRVPRLFEVERYETVHQLTSTVRSRTRPGATLVDVFRALFPSGSVTGAPKVRTSEIIREMEDGPRGIYTGTIGFVSPGEAVFSVAIRTLVVERASGAAELGVGSGITFDSLPDAEHDECLAKAAFVRAEPRDFRLLETLRFDGDRFLLLEGHLRRLAASAAYFGFRYDEGAAREALAGALEGCTAEPLRVRLLLERDGDLAVEAALLSREPAGPLRVAFAAEPVDSRDPFLYHKTTRREGYERRAAAHPGHDDVILVNERGEVTEATIANVVVEIGGALHTPPLRSGLLPGVYREHLLEEGRVGERVLTPEEVRAAERLWLVNSVREWRRAELG